MRLLLFITFLSICFSGSSQTEHTTFLKLKTTDFNQNYPELPFGRIIVVDNQLDSTPISIQGGKNQIFEKFRLDSPVSRTLAAFLSEEFKQVLSGPNVLTILMNECRFYTTAGQIRERGGKLRKVNSAKLMKINLTLFTQGSETYKVNPVYVGTLDRFFKVEKVDDIPRIFQNACIGAILLSAHKRTQASTINIHGLQGATISMDDDIDLVLQRKSFDSLTKGESPFIKTVLAYGKPIQTPFAFFNAFRT